MSHLSNSIKIVLLTCYLLATVAAVKINQKTTNGEDCMTDCIQYKTFLHNYHYCWTGFRDGDWEYCVPTKDPTDIIYHSDWLGTVCISKCGKYRSKTDSDWCWVREDRSIFSYCSSIEGRSSHGYKCSDKCTSDNTGRYYCPYTWLYVFTKYDFCSPPAINVTATKEISKFIREHVQCKVNEDHFSLQRRGDQNDKIAGGVYVVMMGIVYLLNQFLTQYPERYVPLTYTEPNSVTSYITMPAPDRPGLEPVDLPLVVRATIRPEHLTQRTNIPTFVEKQMINMDAIRGLPYPQNDERGHIVAACFGGPNLPLNFVPKSPQTNRRLGRESNWWTNERNILAHVRKGGHVEYTVVVAYGDLLLSRRPIGFAVEVRYFNANGEVERETETMYFTNSPNPHTEFDKDLGFCPAPKKPK